VIDLPPPRFDHAYNGPAIEWVLPDVDAKCRKAGITDDGIILGCSFKIGDACVVLLRERHPLLAQLRRHEIGHCNGWTREHEK
jgi:hypothetical protein